MGVYQKIPSGPEKELGKAPAVPARKPAYSGASSAAVIAEKSSLASSGKVPALHAAFSVRSAPGLTEMSQLHPAGPTVAPDSRSIHTGPPDTSAVTVSIDERALPEG